MQKAKQVEIPLEPAENSRFSQGHIKSPFFEEGEISTPKYDELIGRVVSAKELRSVRFNHENMPYAKFRLKPNPIRRLSTAMGSDFDLWYTSTAMDINAFKAYNEFILCFASARQIMNTLPPQSKFDLGLFQMILSSSFEIPGVLNRLINCLGNRKTPYGTFELEDAPMSILGLIYQGIAALVANPAIRSDLQSADHDEPFSSEICSAFRQVPPGKRVFFTQIQRSKELLIEEARRLWNEEAAKSYDVVIEGTAWTISLPTHDDMHSELLNGTLDVMSYFSELEAVGVPKEKILRLYTLLEISLGTVDGPVKEEWNPHVPDFLMSNIEPSTLLSCVRTAFKQWSISYQPIQRLHYEVTDFKPTDNGNLGQMITLDRKRQVYFSKVNMTKYPQALGCILDLTSDVTVVRKTYIATSSLTAKDGCIFVYKDALPFY